MKNIYNYLSVLKAEDISGINNLLFIDMKHNVASIYPALGTGNGEIDIDIPEERLDDLEFLNVEIISMTLVNLGLDSDGDMISAMVFIKAKDHVIDMLKKEKEKAVIPYVENKPYMNMEFYGSFLGEHSLHDYGSTYIVKVLNVFKKIRHEKVMEYHKLMKILSHDDGTSWRYDKQRMKYDAYMGLDYIYNRHLNYNHDIFSIEDPVRLEMLLLNPLSEINFDYAKHKLHTVNVELAYINRNLKSIRAEFRRRNKTPEGLQMVTNASHEKTRKELTNE